MADIEKVIKALDCRNTYDNDYSCTECPYFSTELGSHHAYCDYHRMMNDAIELLKKQNEVIEELLKVGYPHNFQLEKPHIVNYMQSITKVVKKAVHFRNEEYFKDAEHNRE